MPTCEEINTHLHVQIPMTRQMGIVVTDFSAEGVVANLPPPASPRPPATICAFTTYFRAAIFAQACSASSGVFASLPAGTAMPYWDSISFERCSEKNILALLPECLISGLWYPTERQESNPTGEEWGIDVRR